MESQKGCAVDEGYSDTPPSPPLPSPVLTAILRFQWDTAVFVMR